LSPGDLSKAAAGLASVEGLTPGRAAVFLSICAQTGKDGTCFISQGKLGKRCGMTRKHAHDSVAWLIEKGLLEKESLDGRSCKYTVVGCNLSDTGVSPEAHRGVTSGTHVSSTTSSNTSFRTGRRPRRGPSLAAGTTPTERYEPPTGGMSFSEWKARLA